MGRAESAAFHGVVRVVRDPTEPAPTHSVQPSPPAVARSGNLAVQLAAHLLACFPLVSESQVCTL